MIPVYVRPYEDELLYGWILRLSEYNHLTPEQLLNFYFPRTCGQTSWDTIGALYNNGYEDPLKLLRYHTIYFAIFPFLQEGSQARIIERFLYGGSLRYYHTVSELRICPKCLSEDFRLGRDMYYRVWHQLDEVTMCAVHECSLLTIPKNKTRMLDETMIRAAVSLGQGDLEMARFIYCLYKEPVYTHLKAWRDRLPPKGVFDLGRRGRIPYAMRHGMTSLQDYQYISSLTCEECRSSYVSHPFYNNICGLCPECRGKLTDKELTRKILTKRGAYEIAGSRVRHIACGNLISGTPHQFIWSDRQCKCEYLTKLETYQEEMNDEEFEVVGFRHINGSIRFDIRHRICGSVFTLSKMDYQSNHYCRYCNSYAVKFSEKFAAMVKEEYTLLVPPSTTKEYFRAVHNVCGREFTMRARNFMEGQRCSLCKKDIGYGKIMDLIGVTCDCTGYKFRDMSPDLEITKPDGSVKKIRIARAYQDLTRYDEPEFLVRKTRIEPEISDTAKVYVYIRDHADQNGYFTSHRNYKDIQMKGPSFFASVRSLEKYGFLKRIKKGTYQLARKES